MKHKTMIAALAIFAAVGTVRAADWPMWGGTPARRMVNTAEKGIVTDWDIAAGKNVKWRQPLGSQSYGNPIVYKGHVFCGTNNGGPRDPEVQGDKGIVMCFKEDTGDFLWQSVHDKLESGRVNDWPEQGVCSSPCGDGDRVYWVSNRCEIICADIKGFTDGKNDGPFVQEKHSGPKDADIIWKYDMIEELGVFPHNMSACSPVIVGDRIFVITGNGVDEGHVFLPSPKAPSFVCVDKSTGKLLWESALPGKNILHGQWSNPCFGEVNGKMQGFFPGGDGFLYALTPDKGEVIWKMDCNPKGSVYVLGGRGTKNELIATPCFDNGRVYLGVGQDPEHGEGPGHFYSIDPTKSGDVTDTAKHWQFDKLNRTISTAVANKGLVYAADLSGFFYCLDEETGKELWSHDMLAAIWGSPSIVDGKIYLGDEDGDVAVFAEGKEKKLLGEYSMDNACYGTPVAANGVLFIQSRNELFALAAKK